VGSGAHTTVFDGSGPQTVVFASPGTTSQRFHHLSVENFSGGVNLTSTVPVMGTFFADDVTLRRTGPVGTVVDVRGIAQVNYSTFDGLPLRVTSAQAPPSHSIAGTVFQNMDPADVQLYLEMPGVVGATLSITDAVFDTPAGGFTTGAYVQTQRQSGVEIFTVQFFNVTPNPLTTVIEGSGTAILTF
jgi:hypothetical protein